MRLCSFSMNEKQSGGSIFLPEMRGVCAIAIRSRQKQFGTFQFKFRVFTEKCPDLVIVFRRINTACGIDQQTARFDQSRQCLQNLFLQMQCFFQAFFGKTPRGIGSPTEHTAVGTGDICQNKIECGRRKGRSADGRWRSHAGSFACARNPLCPCGG